MNSNDSEELGPLKSPIPEIRHGFRILSEMMSSSLSHINDPFIAPVDVEGLGLVDYPDIIKEPMWLEKMEEKFLDNSYGCLPEFVCDFRLMLLNCYRFNGVDSRISKLASTMEALFEEKLASLPERMRSKCLLSTILGSSPIPGCRKDFFSGATSRLRIQEFPKEVTKSEDLGNDGNSLNELENARRKNQNQELMETPVLALAREVFTISSDSRDSGLEVAPLKPELMSLGREAVPHGQEVASIRPEAASPEPEVVLLETEPTSHGPEVAILRPEVALPETEAAPLREAEAAPLPGPKIALLDSEQEWDRRQAELVRRLTVLQRRREEARLLEEWPAFEAASLDRPERLVLRHSWELVQIVSFLRLASPVLSLPLEELTIASLEWAVLLPRQSRLLAYIVNSMLTRSSSRSAQMKKPPLHYRQWESKVRQRVAFWYKLSSTSVASLLGQFPMCKSKKPPPSPNEPDLDPWDLVPAATRKFGVEVAFFRVMGWRNPMEVKRYHELSLYQRIHVLKALIDSSLWSQESLTCAMDTAGIEWSSHREVVLGRYDDSLLFHFPFFDFDGRMRLFRIRDPCLPEVDVRTTEDVLHEDGWSRAKEAQENGVEAEEQGEEGEEKCWKRSKKKENAEEAEEQFSEGELQIELAENCEKVKSEVKQEIDGDGDKPASEQNGVLKSEPEETSAEEKVEMDKEDADAKEDEEEEEGSTKKDEEGSDIEDEDESESDSQSIFEAIYAPEVSGPNTLAFEVAASRLEELSAFTQSIRQELSILTAVSGQASVSERTRHRSRAPKPETVTAAEGRKKQLASLLKALERLKEEWKEIAPGAAEVRRQTQLRIRKEVLAYDEAVDNASVEQDPKADVVKPPTSVNPQLVHFDSGDESDRSDVEGGNALDRGAGRASRPYSAGGHSSLGASSTSRLGNGSQAHCSEDDDDDEDFHTDVIGSHQLDTQLSGVSTRRKNYTLINFDSNRPSRASRRRQRPPEPAGSPAAKRVALTKSGGSGGGGGTKITPMPALGARSTMAPGQQKSPSAKIALPRQTRRPPIASAPQLQPQPQILIAAAQQEQPAVAPVPAQSTAQVQIPHQAVQVAQMLPQQTLQASAPIYVIQGAPPAANGAAPVFIFQSAPTIHLSAPMQQPQVMSMPIGNQPANLLLVNPGMNQQPSGQPTTQLPAQALPQTNYTLIPANAPLIAASSHTPSGSSASVTITSPTDACMSSAGSVVNVETKTSSCGEVISGVAEAVKVSQSQTVVHSSPSIPTHVDLTTESHSASTSDLSNCQPTLSMNTSTCMSVTRTSTTYAVGPKPTAYVSPQPMPAAMTPQVDPSPSTVDGSSSNEPGKVTLFQIGGQLFDKDAQPVIVENGAVQPVTSSTIDPDLLRMAASMINVEKNRRQVDNDNNMISSDSTTIGTGTNTGNNQFTITSTSNDGSQG